MQTSFGQAVAGAPMNILKKVRQWMVKSTVVHQYEDPASDLPSLVGVLDRFIDNNPKYGLEWDDFISWEKPNAHAEQVRLRLAPFEGLLFSGSKADRAEYVAKVFEEREKVAALAKIASRSQSI